MNKFKKIIKFSLASLLALTSITVGALNIVNEVEAATNDYNDAYTVKEYKSNAGKEITMEGYGDHFQQLFATTETDEFTFSADVMFSEGYNNKRSAALMFGIKNRSNENENAIKVNINADDSGIYGRAWGYATPGYDPGNGQDPLVPFKDVNGQNRPTNYSAKFRMVVQVEKVGGQYKLIRHTYNIDDNGNEIANTRMSAEGMLFDNYTGGTFGLMVFDSKVTFSNITIESANGTYVHEGVASKNGTTTLNSVYGNTFAVMSKPNVKAFDFVYESDVTIIGGRDCAALTFGIEDPNNPAAKWFGANFNFGDNKARLFKEGGYDNTTGDLTNVIQSNKKIHMRLEVNKNKYATLTLNNVGEEEAFSVGLQLDDSYTGGYLGLLTWETGAKFENTKVYLGNKFEITQSTDFVKVNSNDFALDETNKTLTLGNTGGDNFSMFAIPVNTNAFTMEADVNFTSTEIKSAGLMFGASSPVTPGSKWYAANVDSSRANNKDCFRVFGDGKDFSVEQNLDGYKGDINLNAPLHLKLVMNADGKYTYTFGNVNGTTKEMSGTIPNWNGGYLGLLTWNASGVFSNIRVVNNHTIKTVSTTPLENNGGWKTNLTGLSYDTGTWTINENGLTSNAEEVGDAFLLTESTGTNFVYSTDVKFNKDSGAAALTFRSNNDLTNKETYAVNVDASGVAKIWRWYRNGAQDLINLKNIEKTSDNTYTLKVVAYKAWLLFYVNDVLVGSTGDYTLEIHSVPKDYISHGQNTAITSGYFGLLNYNSDVVFQNTYYTEFDANFNPIVTDIKVTPIGDEKVALFTKDIPTMIQYVDNNVETVDFDVTTLNSDSVVKVKKGNTEYENGEDVPLNVGKNIITVESTDTKDGVSATVTYHVNVHRLDKDELYYNEPYRGQYHYSVREGWANDPNGMVYYKGKWHLFHQFYDDTTWGPMHWYHVTSDDLLTWEEEPITFVPDAFGAEFSGCMVADTTNTSGLFNSNEGGLVALITKDGNGQRVQLAYSEDEGATWTKVEKIAVDWSNDPLNDGAFRDPKVFRWENKWFMVIAGGPLRIYSSDNLREWKCESTYGWLHTECPDLYPLEASDGTVKWVLSRGGRTYKVGDFKQVDGNWTFVPDAAYEGDANNGIMNFARDSYAAMTYYIQDFGKASNPTLPEIIEINWMNNWDYCNDIANTVGQKFNGTFNLQLSLGLIKEGNNYVLTQTPISQTTTHGGYEQLRESTALFDTNGFVDVETNNTLLSSFSGDTYEIKATFKPGTDTTRVGFKLRTGSNQETYVYYDLGAGRIYLDRSKASGFNFNDKFLEVTSQSVTRNADGSIDMHIYVDKASVEVFAKNYTVSGAVQVFPNPASLGASVVVEGGTAQADIEIYKLNSIWNKANITTPTEVFTENSKYYCVEKGGKVNLSAYVLPIDIAQDLTWSVVSGSEYVSILSNGNKLTVNALKEGVAVIRVASTVDPTLTKEFTIKVHNNEINLNNFNVGYGNANNWHVDGDGVLNVSDPRENSTIMSKDSVAEDFVLETDIAYTRGMVNIFFSSDIDNPIASKAYAVQFDNARNVVRLFRFDINGDTKLGALPENKPVNNGEYFHVTIEKTGKTVRIYVNGELCLTHTYDDVVSYFNNPAKVGLGIWDGSMKIKNFVVKETTDITDHFDAFDALDSDDYTEVTYNAYKEAVDAAKAGITPDNMETLKEALEAAESGLAEVALLTEAINDAKQALSAGDYTTVSKTALETLISEAEALYVSGSKTDVAEAITDLEEGIDALADISELKEVVKEAKEALSAGDYTTASKATLETLISEAEALYVSGNKTDVAEAITDLEEGTSSLVDISGIKDLIDAVKSIDTVGMSDEFVENLKILIDELEALLVNGSQDVVSDYLDELPETLERVAKVEDTIDALLSLPAANETETDDEDAVIALDDALALYEALDEYEKAVIVAELVDDMEALIAKLKDYKVLEGNNAEISAEADKDLVFVVNGAFIKFNAIKVDGKEVAASYYSAKEGSTVVTLKANYIDTLSAGKHEITFIYEDGEVSANFTVKAKVPTGDKTNVFGLFVMMVLALGVLFNKKED